MMMRSTTLRGITMRVLTRFDLRARKGIPYSRQHLERMVRAGEFPVPFKLGNGPKARNAWDEREIDAWLKARARSRKVDQARKNTAAEACA
jgi:prophage regulatory protein